MTDGYWALKRKERRATILALVTNSAHKPIFDEAYFQALYERKRAIAVAGQKETTFQRIILLFLFLALLFPNTTISVLGASGTVSDLREVLLLISATLQGLGTFSLSETARIDDFLEVHCEKLSNGDREVLNALRTQIRARGLANDGIAEIARNETVAHDLVDVGGYWLFDVLARRVLWHIRCSYLGNR